MVLSFQEEELAVVSEDGQGVVGIVLQGVTWGVIRGTPSPGSSRLHIKHFLSTNRF
jgi:hypothetical protein